MLAYGTSFIGVDPLAAAGVVRAAYTISPLTLQAVPVAGHVAAPVQIGSHESDVRLTVDWSACVPRGMLLLQPGVTIRQLSGRGVTADATTAVLLRRWLRPGPVQYVALHGAQPDAEYLIDLTATLSDGQVLEATLPRVYCRI